MGPNDKGKQHLLFRWSLILLFSLGFPLSVNGRPKILGPGTVFASLGQNLTIECNASNDIIWYRISAGEDLISHPENQSLLERSLQEAPNLELYGESEFPENFTAVIELAHVNYNDQGLYICIREFPEKRVSRILKKKKEKHYSAVLLIVNVSVPIIEGEDTLTVDAEGDVNFTCKGDKPVTWVATNNLTHGIQHTDEILSDKSHTSVMELINVNYTDVGYYFCIFTERRFIYEYHDHKKDQTVASVYLFVKDVNHLIAGPADEGTITYYLTLNEQLIIPCKPTFPDVEVTLLHIMDGDMNLAYDPREGFFAEEPSIALHEGSWWCRGHYQDKEDKSLIQVELSHYRSYIPMPTVKVIDYWQKNAFERLSQTFTAIEGRNISINCTGVPKRGEEMVWIAPSGVNKTGSHLIYRNNPDTRHRQARSFIDISIQDSGKYGCYIHNVMVNSTLNHVSINFISENSPLLRMEAQNERAHTDKDEAEDVMWVVYFSAYPTIHLKWIFEETTLAEIEVTGDHEPAKSDKKNGYEIAVSWRQGEIKLRIRNPTYHDVGVHKLVGITGYLTQELLLEFVMSGSPAMVEIKINPTNYLVRDKIKLLIDCIAYGHPLPELDLVFLPCQSKSSCNAEYLPSELAKNNGEFMLDDSNSTHLTAKRRIRWVAEAFVQGKYICKANNEYGFNSSEPLVLTITDSTIGNVNALQIETKKTDEMYTEAEIVATTIEGDFMEITCRGNNMLTSAPLSWIFSTDESVSYSDYSGCQLFKKNQACFKESSSNYSWIYSVEMKASLDIDGLLLTCLDDSDHNRNSSLKISVIKATAPRWTSTPLAQQHYEKKEKEHINLYCSADGAPQPIITWMKDDDRILEHDEEDGIIIEGGNLTIHFLYQKDSGKFTCKAENREGKLEDWITLQVEDMDANAQTVLVIVIGTVIFILVVVSIIFIIKIIGERKRNLRIKREIQMFFEKGNPDRLNPDLDLGVQADLLPYDKKFEFPRRNIIFEKLLGSGEFGNVFKAKALNLVAGESKTTVAVKTMKSQASDDHLKTLRTELKIMIHIGRHINIVNLLGACSKELASKGELLLIVEYCKFGNIQEYMRLHKNGFSNQINEHGRIDPSVKFSRRNRMMSQAPMNYAQLDVHSPQSPLPFYNNVDQSKSPNWSDANCEEEPLATILLNEHSDSARNGFSSMQDAQSPTEEDNYILKGLMENRAPLSTHTLLQWGYQVANGMFYLSERKVIHGDLAARNILLTDKNIVKISDFGLAKNIYKNTQYKKRTNAPVPVKWVSIEALRDGIYSTQSDVWAFGIVLWEVFTLGKNPYPGIEYDDSFIKKLEDGLRLPKPEFATNEIYYLMEWCWRQNPNERPSFRYLEKKFGDLLGESERQDYLRLNEPYGQDVGNNDLLLQIRTPSYDTRVNGSFGEVDISGYEKPISFMQAEIPEQLIEPLEGASFVLQPVPKKKRPVTLILDDSQKPSEENEPFLERDYSQPDYMTMQSPTKSQSEFTFQEGSPDSPAGSDYLCMQTPKQMPDSPLKLKEVDENSPSYRNVDFRTPSEDVEDEAMDRQHKRDSGIHSPCSTLQVNPEYMYTCQKEFNSDSLEKEDNHRIRLDSSSGASSMSYDSCNSLEKKNTKMDHLITQIKEENDASSFLSSYPPQAV